MTEKCVTITWLPLFFSRLRTSCTDYWLGRMGFETKLYWINRSIFRDDSNVGSGVGGGAFTRWLREFRRETYKVNANGVGVNGGDGDGTYITTAEDGRRRHSFNAHDKNADHHRIDPKTGNATHGSRPTCRRANSTAAPKSRYVSYFVVVLLTGGAKGLKPSPKLRKNLNYVFIVFFQLLLLNTKALSIEIYSLLIENILQRNRRL